MSLLLGQIVIPSEGVSASAFQPLVIGGLIYALLVVAGRTLEGREHPRSGGVLDASFLVLILLAIYTVVLVIVAFFFEYELVFDMLEVVAIVVGFFALLIFALLFVELGVGTLGRERRRRRGG